MFKKSFSMYNFCSRRFLSVKQTTEYDWTNQYKKLMEPFEHIHNLHTKYNELMAPAFDHWLQIPKQKVDIIQEALHICMTWTMLLDDIQDDSYYRFGVPAAHRIYGVGLTINAANNALFLARKQIAELQHPAALDLYWKAHDDFFCGQGVDIYWREKNILPTADDLIEMSKRKSGTWYVLPIQLMQLFSTNKTDYTDLAYQIGTYYTMVDDYLNLFKPEGLQMLSTSAKQENYAPANDITESKMSLAIVHALRCPDVATELADILKQRTQDIQLVNRALSLLKKHGSDEYARNVLNSFEGEIRTEIDRLGGNAKLMKLMDGISV